MKDRKAKQMRCEENRHYGVTNRTKKCCRSDEEDISGKAKEKIGKLVFKLH